MTMLLTYDSTDILLVDDNPDNLRLLASILETRGYKVRKTISGKMALQAARRKVPDLILLDINMPELNGYDVCRQLKAAEITRNIPIIFISALDQLGDKLQAFELGGVDYITKPFQELEVLARVKMQLLLLQQRRQLEHEVQERVRAEAEIKTLNLDLENQVKLRTLELQKALNFEATLKRISDKVRDSLDPYLILQTAVEELAQAVEVQCCDAVLYSSDHTSSTIRHQWVQPGQVATQGQTLVMTDAPEVYTQLQQGWYFAFCQIQDGSIRNHAAILACPIFDDQIGETGILGDLWLFKPTSALFSGMEIHLVEQVANQCAIALRQARLYAAAQAQVKELQRLNRLKDDFLSTISHELRTPIASVKLATRMLTFLLEEDYHLATEYTKPEADRNKVAHYLQVLQQECDRELDLIKDLLDLQHLNAGLALQEPVSVELALWLPHVLEPFEQRTRQQQQTLQLDLAANLPPLFVDLAGLNRVVTELVNNACKYTPAGGAITVKASMQEQLVCLEVSNWGVEIPTEELPRVFDKFYRIPNSDPWKHYGTGLGLTLVKKLLEQMNGTIAVSSGKNLTCFTVHLPLAPN